MNESAIKSAAARPSDDAARPVSTAVTLGLFKVVWLAVVFSAVWALPWLGVLAVGAFLAYQTRIAGQEGVLLPVLIVGVAGYCIDAAYVWSGLLAFDHGYALPAPLWMALLWMNFAMILDSGLAWLRGRPLLAAVLGAIGGPAAYSAGVSLGLLELLAAPAVVYAVIALTWALALPALIASVRLWPARSVELQQA